MRLNLLIILGLLLLIYSCTRNKTESNQPKIVSDSAFTNISYERKASLEFVYLDSIKHLILEESKTSKDTLKYQFSIEDIGTEGNEGTAYYVNSELKKVKFEIYTSMWKIDLLYLFNKENIQVTEETFNTYENIKQVKKLSYLINIDGVPLGKVYSSRVDVFQQIREKVPFTLK